MCEKTITVLLLLCGFLFNFTYSSFTTDIGSKRYLIVTDTSVNWYLANNACSQSGMSLMSIESDVEYANLRKYLLDQGMALHKYN